MIVVESGDNRDWSWQPKRHTTKQPGSAAYVLPLEEVKGFQRANGLGIGRVLDVEEEKRELGVSPSPAAAALVLRGDIMHLGPSQVYLNRRVEA
ncbi:uncharacterized protein N7469_004686 [Penicillium citrinum]|uniref:Uncharacterized protein n=2 Tax=Penicillium TaxID=5073 RepID=A0A9W9P4X2_PENCI|nr:uncharacterized protein N7469_004686 [Penicillium citrinum]KAJ5235518.1 hypothetical protein N7469_004686 [Penicillium citrinum]KAJ5591083.1 hypothetical protein N7450_005055 [Penicillium hetheringtonii]KAK5800119.1 hypothetical protein VI817_002331 [Penicillium citrinum]